MNHIDKAAIVWSVAIVATAVAFTIGISSSIASDAGTVTLSDAQQQTVQKIQEKTDEIISGVNKQSKEIGKDVKQLAENTEEYVTSKLPVRLVSIPFGTSVPGCEEVDLCYDPPSLIIFQGGEVIWRNDDLSSHTVTSGTALEGPNGEFDSGLMRPNETFSHEFDAKGEFFYFCMIHPWAKASVTVA